MQNKNERSQEPMMQWQFSAPAIFEYFNKNKNTKKKLVEKQAKNDQKFPEQFRLVWVTEKLILFLYLNKTDNNLLVDLVDNLLRFFPSLLFLDFVCVERSSKIYRSDGSSFAIYTTSSGKGFIDVKFITGSFSV